MLALSKGELLRVTNEREFHYFSFAVTASPILGCKFLWSQMAWYFAIPFGIVLGLWIAFLLSLPLGELIYRLYHKSNQLRIDIRLRGISAAKRVKTLITGY